MTNTQDGIVLATLPDALTKVPAHLTTKPIRSFDALGRMGAIVERYLASAYDDPSLEANIHNLSWQAYNRLTIDETAKIVACSRYAINSGLEDHLAKNPVHAMIKKIRSSMWRWGYQRAGWNETVDAYNGLRSFEIGVEGFAVTLDHTTGHNERGYSEYSRTYLDGVFAYLVYYKGEHVMTVGFSIISGRRILVQQIQLKQARGNRWLFKFPSNRIEYVIERLQNAFPHHKLLIADGADIAQISLDSYRRGLRSAEEEVRRYTKRLDNAQADEDTSDLKRYLNEAIAHVAENKAKADHLEADIARLAELYRNSGRFIQGKPLVRNHITHYALAA